MTSMDKPSETKLSATVLDMKFMQRTKRKLEEQERKKKEQLEKKKLLRSGQIGGQNEKVKEEPREGSSIEIVRNYEKLEDLSFGRLSFKGFNPEVEKLMVYYDNLKRGGGSDEESDDDRDVNDADMAAVLGGTLAKKFMTKNERAQQQTFIDEVPYAVKRAAESSQSDEPSSKREKVM